VVPAVSGMSGSSLAGWCRPGVGGNDQSAAAMGSRLGPPWLGAGSLRRL